MQHAADLFQDRADVQQAERWELAVELGQHLAVAVVAEAGEPGLRLAVQRARREDKVKVRLQAFPIHLAQAGDFGAERLGIAAEGQRVAQRDLQPPGDTFIHRDFAAFRRPIARH